MAIRYMEAAGTALKALTRNIDEIRLAQAFDYEVTILMPSNHCSYK